MAHGYVAQEIGIAARHLLRVVGTGGGGSRLSPDARHRHYQKELAAIQGLFPRGYTGLLAGHLILEDARRCRDSRRPTPPLYLTQAVSGRDREIRWANPTGEAARWPISARKLHRRPSL